jgi:HEPN domain-containing protein
MPHNPELVAEVRDWLQRAMEDLREAEHDLVAGVAREVYEAVLARLPKGAHP